MYSHISLQQRSQSVNSVAAHSLPIRLFVFQILGSYHFQILFYIPLKISTCLIVTNISDYHVTGFCVFINKSESDLKI